MKKRILVLLTVVAMMMVMLAMSVALAFASPNPNFNAIKACSPGNPSHPPAADFSHHPPFCT
jgi:hypothetical protein